MSKSVLRSNPDVFAEYAALTSGQLQTTPFTPFKQGICLVRMGRLAEARDGFQTATTGLLKAPGYWMTTGEPNVMIEALVLSGQRDLVPQSLVDGLQTYNRSPKGKSLVSQYAMAAVSLLVQGFSDAEAHISRLLSHQDVKWTYSIGLVLRAIVKNDSLLTPLRSLIETYQTYSRREFRWDARRFLCTPAMCLATWSSDNIEELEGDLFCAEYLRLLSGRDQEDPVS